MRPMRLLTILLRFGTDKYPRAEAHLNELFERHLAGISRELVVVDNAQPPGYLERNGGRTLIGGDNRFREFSGFDRAVAHVGRDIRAYDLVQCVTDAFHTLYVDYLERFDTALLEAMAGRPVAVGHIDCYNDPIQIFGIHSQHWIRTGYFFLSPDDVLGLGSFVGVREPERFFSGNPAEPFRADAPLSRRYQEYLIDWITGQSLGQGVQWHSSFALTDETLPSFEQKALAIMNEQMLGIRLRAMRCRVVDVTWLSTTLKGGTADMVDWSADWRRQLAGRDHAALVMPG